MDDVALAAAHVAVIEVEAVAAGMLAAAGFPADLTRAPTAIEVASRVNFATLERSRTDAEQALVGRALAARADTITALAVRLSPLATVADVLALLDDLAAGSTALPELATLQAAVVGDVETRLRTAAAAGLDTWLADATSLGVVVPARTISTAAELAASAQARRIAADALDAGLRAVRGAAYATPRAGVVDVPAFVEDITAAARETGTRGLEDVARQGALRVHGAGRAEGQAATTRTGLRWYASELLDRNTCSPCADKDGTEYDTADAALADYPSGGFVGCRGGDRCRGTLVSVLEDETPATLTREGSSATRSPEAANFYRNRPR